jgi:DNA-binding response OmpR family regulator
MDSTILIIEDELSLLNILAAYFKKSGFNTLIAKNGLEGLELFKSSKVDIVCCDVMMPIIDGWEVSRSIRQLSDIPIILMTALDSEEDQLTGYKLDIDDYVTKPFSPSILVAKAKRLVNRYNSKTSDTKINQVIFGDFSINFLSRSVKVRDEDIKLSKTEFDLLEFLIRNKDIAVNRVTILDEVWGMDVYVEERVVDTNIKVLRKKLLDYGDSLVTVFGIGYKFVYEKKN